MAVCWSAGLTDELALLSLISEAPDVEVIDVEAAFISAIVIPKTVPTIDLMNRYRVNSKHMNYKAIKYQILFAHDCFFMDLLLKI